jgi:FkbH-like protein
MVQQGNPTLTVTSLAEIFDRLKPTPASYLEAERLIHIAASEYLKPLRVAFLSTFTADVLKPYLTVESARCGLAVEQYFGPWNQLEQQILDKSSNLYDFKPQVVIIAARLEEIAPDLIVNFMRLSAADIQTVMNQIQIRFKTLLENLQRENAANVLLFNYSAPLFFASGIADPCLEISQASIVQGLNNRLACLSQEMTGIYIFDYARLANEVGLKRVYDSKLWYMAKIPWSAEAQMEIGKRLARYLRALCFAPVKCLVVDLDNTLWGGILGEEGIGGIALGEDYPGNIYKDFQKGLLTLRDRGILLAIASKNNETEALNVFEKHPDCVLKLRDFAACQIHWQDKAKSISAIAKELRIGTDAIAFLDDDPIEREWIRTQMPEVTVLEISSNPVNFLEIEAAGVFDQLVVSREDKLRTEYFQQERERKQAEARSQSLEEFLQNLRMQVVIGYVDVETFPRVGQLIAKTNQFNLTSRRYTLADLNAIMKKGALGLWIRVRDRFGDYGLVGTAIAVPHSRVEWIVDTFLLSCRVIGRKIEDLLLGVLAERLRQKGCEILVGEYIPTPKNVQVRDFYQRYGFERLQGERNLWKRDLKKGLIPIPEIIQVSFQDETDRQR